MAGQEKMVNLGLELPESLMTEAEEYYAVRFGPYQELVPEPGFVPKKPGDKAPMQPNSISKRQHMCNKIKQDMKRVVADGRAEDELKIKRAKEKDIKGFD